jgi:hypothetical protein
MTNLSAWTSELRTLFPQPEEYDLAAEIYSFSSAFEDGMSPQEAYDDFAAWCDAE